MDFGGAWGARLKELKKLGADLPGEVAGIARMALEAAVETAAALTPPEEDGPLRGTGTITGAAKSLWAADSSKAPALNGNEHTAELANTAQYISYLNDGHRMDRHFVPGLMLNPYNGLLERADIGLGGITVGTATEQTRPLRIKERALEAHERTALAEAARVAERLRSRMKG
jgi:hypothetical protein